MKLFILLLMLFSSAVNAITVQELIDKHSKERVISFISERTDNKLTIFFNDEFKKAHRPSSKYITARTIAMDLNLIGLSANKVDALFTGLDNEKYKEELKRKAIAAGLKEEQRIEREARTAARLKEEEAERLRPKDKYDLAVAQAINRGV